MKKMTKTFWFSLFGLFIIYGSSLFAQAPTYYCEIRNESFVASNIFEFDLYLTRSGSVPLELAGINTGIILNTNFVNGGSITPSLMPGSELNTSQVPANIAYDAVYRCVKIAPKKPPRDYGTGLTSGTMISNTTGTKVCRVRLTNSVDFGADPLTYTWSMNLWPYHTVVGAFVSGVPHLVSAVITDATSHSMANSLTLFLEGLFIGTGNHQAQDEFGNHFGGPVADVITVKLANATTHSIDYTSNPSNVYTNGNCSFSAPASISGSYYLVVNHRNSIETWSASPVVFGSGMIAYNFTDAASKAFGSNMIEKAAGKWAFFSGDVNQDGLVDSGDMNPVENASTAITYGYVVEDVNGDGLVDSGDMNLTENNSMAIVMIQSPF
jgi:hypothetical protein